MEPETLAWLMDLDRILKPPARVVSLVPSLTESLFDLGWGGRVVGVTDFCKHPEHELANLPRLGGTKTPRVEEIIDLAPDLVIANREENERAAVEALLRAGIPTWITFPQNVPEALALLYALARLFRDSGASQRIKTLETAVEWTQAATSGGAGFTYFCPIWQGVTQEGKRWWMTFNQDTYAHSLLELFGGRNVFASRLRQYPLSADLVFEGDAGGRIQTPPADEELGERDTRYPVVSSPEVESADPEVILLPDEPFPFSGEHKDDLEAMFAQTSAVKEGRVFLVDGSLITWHGTRLALSIQQLPPLFAGLEHGSGTLP